jgi:uncharacterized protein YkwD
MDAVNISFNRALLLCVALCLAAPFVSAEPITSSSVLGTMNAYRKVTGLAPYFIDPRLTAAAEDRMRHMEDLGYWAHQAPDGTSPFTWVEKRGFNFSMAGENLAEGYETVEVLVDSWMQSSGHRANILSPAYTSVGIAIIDGHVQRRAIGRSVVVIFAREMVQRVPKAQLRTERP